MTLFDAYNRYSNPQAVAATDCYVKLARKHGLDPAQMALAFVHQQPFVGSTIIGATTMMQLQSNFASAELVLSSEVMEEIETIHRCYPNPAP